MCVKYEQDRMQGGHQVKYSIVLIMSSLRDPAICRLYRDRTARSVSMVGISKKKKNVTANRNIQTRANMRGFMRSLEPKIMREPTIIDVPEKMIIPV